MLNITLWYDKIRDCVYIKGQSIEVSSNIIAITCNGEITGYDRNYYKLVKVEVA